MPFVKLTTTTSIEKEKEMEISHALARVIELIPGKSEAWVMTHIEDNAAVAFAGTDDAPAAYLEVRTFGELAADQYSMLTEKFCETVEALTGVPKDRTYVIYEPIRYWGWNSQIF